jgi:hypothetical protein
MVLWNEPSRKEPASKDSAAAEPTRKTDLAAVPPAATPAVNRESPAPVRVSRSAARLTAAALSFMVLATAGNTATAQAVSGAADGGSTGIVATTFASGFTMTTATGITVTVNETPFTKTVDTAFGEDGDGGRDVRKGTSVLVVGLDHSGNTITADWVVIQPHGDGGAAAAKAQGVIPFQSGVASPAQSIGTIPASYTEGVGTLVSGTQAYVAVWVAQAVIPGGIVDRVVSLSDGSYEVHNISINWPHHVFVSKDYVYLGAE